MTKKENDKPGGGKMHFSDFPPQTIILGLLTAVVMGIYFLARPFWDAYWLPIMVTAIGLISLVLLSFWRGLWRNYRWIVGSTILILLVLINVSWAKSNLGINALEKRQLFQCSIPFSNSILHVEYPPQILYNSQNIPSLSFILWAETADPSSSPSVKITANGFLLGSQISKDSPIEWGKIIETDLPVNGNALTILFLPISHNLETTIEATFNIENTCAKPEKITMILEGKQDAQHRMWAIAFLDTGGIIVSLVLGVFAALKQLEDEKKRQWVKQVEQSIMSSSDDFKKDFSGVVNNHLTLTSNWNEWDAGLQEQFRRLYSSFEEKLWIGLLSKSTLEIVNDVELCLQVCTRIFEGEKGKPILTLKQLQSALQNDGNAPHALLSMLKQYPASINTAKIIASAFSLALKLKTIGSGPEFTEQIRSLRDELGFLDTDGFPLQEQFTFYAKPHTSEERLTNWLKARGLDYSPFADADSPFYSVPNKSLLMDSVAPGFTLPSSYSQNTTFEFTNSWDAGAALFKYCKSFQSAVKIKEETFFIAITPSLIEDHGMDQPRKLYLHALAEQWIWSLAETPTLLYSLQDEQRDLAGRLLCWHDLSPSITVNKIERYARNFKVETKNQTTFSSKIKEWLTMVGSDDLRTEETNALIGLRPVSKQNSLFLISAIDLNPAVEEQLSSGLREKLASQSDWLSVHDCQQIHFQIGNKKRLFVPQPSLVTQCNNRVRICSQSKVDAFNFLFIPHNEEPAEGILARKAAGSPGRMVRLGQKLLLQHVEKYSPSDKENYEYLHIEDLEALEI